MRINGKAVAAGAEVRRCILIDTVGIAEDPRGTNIKEEEEK
jgi:hypothetical protein